MSIFTSWLSIMRSNRLRQKQQQKKHLHIETVKQSLVILAPRRPILENIVCMLNRLESNCRVGISSMSVWMMF
jgi:hypothetical protein